MINRVIAEFVCFLKKKEQVNLSVTTVRVVLLPWCSAHLPNQKSYFLQNTIYSASLLFVCLSSENKATQIYRLSHKNKGAGFLLPTYADLTSVPLYRHSLHWFGNQSEVWDHRNPQSWPLWILHSFLNKLQVDVYIKGTTNSTVEWNPPSQSDAINILLRTW